MSIKITVLCDNTVGLPLPLAGEWGLALLVEVGDKKILFDAGGQGHVVANAATLGVDLGEVEAVVMSHGHHDHAGGLRSFLQLRGQVPVYAHPDFFSPHYTTVPWRRYIGVPYNREELESLGAEFVFTWEPREIFPLVWVSGEVPRKSGFELGDGSLFCLREGVKLPDPLRDDLSLYCVTEEGIVVIVGCAHAGLINIVEHAREVTRENRIYGIIGGTHLGMVAEEVREETIRYLEDLDLSFLAANHCTGLRVMIRLADVFGSRFHFAPVGASFSLPLEQAKSGSE